MSWMTLAEHSRFQEEYESKYRTIKTNRQPERYIPMRGLSDGNRGAPWMVNILEITKYLYYDNSSTDDIESFCCISRNETKQNCVWLPVCKALRQTPFHTNKLWQRVHDMYVQIERAVSVSKRQQSFFSMPSNAQNINRTRYFGWFNFILVDVDRTQLSFIDRNRNFW